MTTAIMAFDRRTTTINPRPTLVSSSPSRSHTSSSSSSSTPPTPNKNSNRSGWTTSHKEKQSWFDTSTKVTVTNSTIAAGSISTNVSPNSRRQQNRVQHVPESPPSSPLPLDFKSLEIDSDDEEKKTYQYQQNEGRVNSEELEQFHSDMLNRIDRDDECEVSPRTPVTMRLSSSRSPSNSESAQHKLNRTLKKQTSTRTGTSAATMTATSTCIANTDIKSRPRFTLSTNVNPRPPAYTTTGSTVSPSTTSPLTNTATKTKRPKVFPKNTKSTVSSENTYSGDREQTKSMSVKKVSTKTRPPTTITMSTTRCVVSTTIDGQNGDIRNRKESTTTTTVVAAAKKGGLGLGLTGLGIACNRTERPIRQARVKSPSSSSSGPMATGKEKEKTRISSKAKSLNVLDQRSQHSSKIVDERAIDLDQSSAHLLPAAEMDISTSEGLFIVQKLEDTIVCQESTQDRNLLNSESLKECQSITAIPVVVQSRVSPSTSYVNDQTEFRTPEQSPIRGPSQIGKITELEATSDAIQRTSTNRISLLSVLGDDLSKNPLTRAKDPAVMMEIMTIMKERRKSLSCIDNSINSFDNDTDSLNVNTKNGDPYSNSIGGNSYQKGERSSNSVHISTSLPSSISCISLHEKKSFLKLQEMRRNRLKRSQSVNSNTTTSSINIIRDNGSDDYIRLNSSDYFSSLHSTSAPSQFSVQPHYLSSYPCESGNSGINTARQQHFHYQQVPVERLLPSISSAVTAPPKVASALYDMEFPFYKSVSTPDLPSTTPPLPVSKSISASTSMTSLGLSQAPSPSLSAASTPRSMSSMSLHPSFPECLFSSRSPSPVVHQRPVAMASPLLRAQSPSQFSRDPSSTTPHVAGSPLLSVPRRTLSRPTSWESIPMQQQQQQQFPQQQFQQHQFPQQQQYPYHNQFQHYCQHQQQQGYLSRYQSVQGQYWDMMHTHENGSYSNSRRMSDEGLPGSEGHPQLNQVVPCVESNYSDTYSRQHPLQHSSDPYFPHQAQNSHHSHQESPYLNNVAQEPTSSSYFGQDMTQTRRCSQDSTQDQHFEPKVPVREHNISMLTKRLANLELMDSICPGKSQQLPQTQQQQQVQHRHHLDITWASHIHQLLMHLSEQSDMEQKAPQPSIPSSPIPSRSGKFSGYSAGANSVETNSKTTGAYEVILTDWMQRLDQIPEVCKEHPGLRREIDKIRWQYGIAKRTCPLNV